jgi:uncharacterized membrane protein
MVVTDNNNDTLQIVLTPNRSASWRFNCFVLKVFGFVVFGIAIFWAFMGAWVVLPFAGLEFALLVSFIYRTSYDSYRKEVLHLKGNRIRFERGRNVPTASFEFDTNACEFIRLNPKHFWTAATIKIRCRGEYMRIGRFLNRDDINQLWRTLTATGVRHREEGKVAVKEGNIFGL